AMRGSAAQRAGLRTTGARFYSPVRAALVAAIRDGQRTGAFAPAADAVTLANVTIAAIEGVRLQHQLDPRAPRKTRVIAAGCDLGVGELTRTRARSRRRGSARRVPPR